LRSRGVPALEPLRIDEQAPSAETAKADSTMVLP